MSDATRTGVFFKSTQDTASRIKDTAALAY